MPTIWKYPLHPGTTQHNMPRGATVLHAQMQQGEPVLWALVEPSADQELRTFDVYGTGHGVRENAGEYIATFQMDGGALVWHVFERRAAA